MIFTKLPRLLDGAISAFVKLRQLGAQDAFHRQSPPTLNFSKKLRVNRQLFVRTPLFSGPPARWPPADGSPRFVRC